MEKVKLMMELQPNVNGFVTVIVQHVTEMIMIIVIPAKSHQKAQNSPKEISLIKSVYVISIITSMPVINSVILVIIVVKPAKLPPIIALLVNQLKSVKEPVQQMVNAYVITSDFMIIYN